jgi:hypothetical protein
VKSTPQGRRSHQVCGCTGRLRSSCSWLTHPQATTLLLPRLYQLYRLLTLVEALIGLITNHTIATFRRI